MEFRIADTFTDSLARLTGEEQKATKTAAFDLQVNPAQPSLQLHKLDKSKDPNFWSIRVSRDLRIIVHRTGASLLLCYVNHHDEAYQWAERRRLETHPKTGAAQLVEVRERIQEIAVQSMLRLCNPSPKSGSSTISLKARSFRMVFRPNGCPRFWMRAKTVCWRSPAICRQRPPKHS